LKALVLTAHPCADSYNHAVSAATVRGLKAGGHDVTHIDLYAIDFVTAMSKEEHDAYRDHAAPPDALVREHGELALTVDTLVFVYPTWWSGPPAILKGWLERVLVPGVGFTFDARGKVQPGLTNVRRIVGVSTYGSPWSYVKLINDNGRRMLTRALRSTCGRHTATTWLGLYSIDTLGTAEREAFLDRVEHAMVKLR
jgi:putative NADPH-quinone reductase